MVGTPDEYSLTLLLSFYLFVFLIYMYNFFLILFADNMSIFKSRYFISF